MKKLHQFRPTVGEAKLEDRVVLAAGYFRNTVVIASLGPRIPATTNARISQVGTAISLDYNAAQNNQVRINQRLTSSLAGTTPGTPLSINLTQAAVNDTLRNLNVNLTNGLNIAAHTIPNGVSNSIHQQSLSVQLTGAGSPLFGLGTTFSAAFAPTTPFTVDAGNEAAVQAALAALTNGAATAPGAAPTSILGAAADSQTVLKTFVATGVANRDFVIVR